MSDVDQNTQDSTQTSKKTDEISSGIKILDYILAGISVLQVVTNYAIFKEYSWGWLPIIFTFNLISHKKGWRIFYLIVVTLNIAAWIFLGVTG